MPDLNVIPEEAIAIELPPGAEIDIEIGLEEERDQRIPSKLRTILDAGERGDNLLDDMDQREIDDIKMRVLEGFRVDEQSMQDYLTKYEDVMDLATMTSPNQDKTFPFVGASQVMMPYLAQACIDFNSRTVPEIVNKKKVAKVMTWGQPDYDKEMRAERVASAINWQLKVGIEGWGERHDKALLDIACIGQYFTKKWWEDGRIKEAYIPSDKMIYDHDSTSFRESERKSHKFELLYNEYKSLVISEVYKELEHFERQDDDKNKTQVELPLDMIESHCTLDLDEDGYCEPYIVTWSDEYEEIVRIEPRFTEDDVRLYKGKVYKIEGEEFFTQTGFIPDMKRPAVYVGYGSLMQDIFESLNTFYRQLLDAGTLNNIAGSSGFINSNVKIGGRARKGKFEMIQGQFTPIDVGSGQNLNNSIFTMPFNGPSAGLFDLLQDLRNEVVAYTTVSQTVDVNPGDAASLYLARLQQALKVPNAIMSRVYRGLGGEFDRIYDLMRRYMPDEEYQEIIDWEPDIDPNMIPPEAQQAYEEAAQAALQMGEEPPPPPEQLMAEAEREVVTKEEDFAEDLDIIPTADPTMGSDTERMARAEAIVERAAANPTMYNGYEVEKNFLTVMGEPRIELMLPKPTGEPTQQEINDQAYADAENQSKMMRAQAEVMRAQKMLADAENDAMKMEAELDKLYSETVKNYADVDSMEAKTAMESVTAMRNMALEAIQLRQEKSGERAESSTPVSSQPMAAAPSI